MNIEEIENKINNLKTKIGPWKVMLNQNCKSQFTMGVFNDTEKKLWIVYLNDERKYRIRLETKNQANAFKELLEMIEFEVENYKNQ